MIAAPWPTTPALGPLAPPSEQEPSRPTLNCVTMR
jgi:hypothetical protein